MINRIGSRTVCLPNRPGILSWSSIAGPKEHDGPYGAQFEQCISDELNGQESFEKAERAMLEEVIRRCIARANLQVQDIHLLLSGDLLNQIISAGFAARSLQIPFCGLYGACSTMSESLSLGGMLADGGYAQRIVCATSSHFCTAERQYRNPLEMGAQRTPTAQWTVTGAGAVLVDSTPAGLQSPLCLTHVTCGRVIDLDIVDQNNMGAAMAPAAADTLLAHLQDLGRTFADYDLVVTGDLGHLGRSLLMELLAQQHMPIDPQKLFDCGCEIYSPQQDTHAGGSGCGCSASMLCAHILPQMALGRWQRILFMATGALLSPTSTLQGESIPGVAHAVVLENRKEATQP